MKITTHRHKPHTNKPQQLSSKTFLTLNYNLRETKQNKKKHVKTTTHRVIVLDKINYLFLNSPTLICAHFDSRAPEQSALVKFSQKEKSKTNNKQPYICVPK